MPVERTNYRAARHRAAGQRMESVRRQPSRPPRKSRLSLFLLIALVIGLAIGFLVGMLVGRQQAAGGTSLSTAPAPPQSTVNSGDSSGPTGLGTTTDNTPTTAATPSTAAFTPIRATAESAKAVGANEMGLVLLLEYHRISTDGTSDDLHRTYQEFRQDIALLKAEGYYPITAAEFASGVINVPAGKSPVVLTFDDSSPGQYRILETGKLDPDCAVGIMQQAVETGDWAPKASFFPLLYVYPEKDILFGQPETAAQKLKQLVAWGYEIGSHTRTHADLRQISADQVAQELAESQAELEELIGGGYRVTTLAVPYGFYPSDESLLAQGEHQGATYRFAAALDAAGGPTPSPFSDRFQPYRIKRVPVVRDNLGIYLRDMRENPANRFVSDGDPTAVSFPATLAPVLGQPRTDLELRVITYQQ